MQEPTAETATEARPSLSRLDPNPEARSSRLAHESPPAVLKPEPRKKSPSKGKNLDIGAGYKIAHKAGSGWSAFLRIMAKECNFSAAVAMLDSPTFDPNDKKQADLLLSKLFVRKDVLEKIVRADAEFQQHGEKKLLALIDRAKKGDKKANETLDNPARVRDGVWLGNVREIISTCNGSYNCRAGATDASAELRKNIKKFDDAGLVFRQFPLVPNKNDVVFVMMFPSKHIDTIKSAIAASLGVVEVAKAKKK